MHNPLFCSIYSFNLSFSDHSLLETNVTMYVAVLKKCFAIYNCRECNNNLSETSMANLSQIQCHFKAYSFKHGQTENSVVLLFLAKNLCNIFLKNAYKSFPSMYLLKFFVKQKKKFFIGIRVWLPRLKNSRKRKK